MMVVAFFGGWFLNQNQKKIDAATLEYNQCKEDAKALLNGKCGTPYYNALFACEKEIQEKYNLMSYEIDQIANPIVAPWKK